MGKVLHASYSGYFPACIEQSEPPAREYTISGSLEDVMSFYWRVKKFNVTFSGSGVGPSPFFTEVEMRGAFDLETTYYKESLLSQASESDLVCNLRRAFRGSGGELLLNGQFFSELSSQIDHSPKYYKNSNIKTRCIIFGGIGVSYFIRNLPPGKEDISGIDYVQVGSYDINFFGGSISGILTAGSFAIASGSLKMVFNATEYWSYGGTYNTTTGEPL
jgi:hypothetical protein